MTRFLVSISAIILIFIITKPSHATDYVRIQYETPQRIQGLNWSSVFFETTVEKTSDGQEHLYALLTGTFNQSNWILMPTDPKHRMILKNEGDPSTSSTKSFIIAIPLDSPNKHVQLQATNPYGETEVEDFNLVLTQGILNFWEKRIRLSSPVGVFKESTSIGDTTTQIAGNIFRVAGDLVYFRAESRTEATLESMLTLGGGYMLSGEDLVFPYLWNGALQLTYRNFLTFGTNKQSSFSPFLKLDGESYSIISNQVTPATFASSRFLSYQSRTFNLYWIGLGFRIQSEDADHWWEISSSFSRTFLSSYSFLSSSSDLFNLSGWKGSLQILTQLGETSSGGSRVFIGIDSSYVTLTGNASISGIQGSGVLGYRF